MPNRLMLAPLTNCQSHPDGTISDEEHRWLAMRAEGGFGLTMTCAAHVQAVGCDPQFTLPLYHNDIRWDVDRNGDQRDRNGARS